MFGTVVGDPGGPAAINIPGMFDLWTLVRFAHLFGVILWIGGMLMMAVIVVPLARAAGNRAMIAVAARRYGIIGGLAWLLLLITGFGLMDHRGVSVGDLPDSEYGRRVMTKLILLLVMGVIVLVHALWQGRKVTRADERGDEAAAHRWRMLGAVFDTLLLIGSLVALWIAASLVG